MTMQVNLNFAGNKHVYSFLKLRALILFKPISKPLLKMSMREVL